MTITATSIRRRVAISAAALAAAGAGTFGIVSLAGASTSATVPLATVPTSHSPYNPSCCQLAAAEHASTASNERVSPAIGLSAQDGARVAPDNIMTNKALSPDQVLDPLCGAYCPYPPGPEGPVVVYPGLNTPPEDGLPEWWPGDWFEFPEFP